MKRIFRFSVLLVLYFANTIISIAQWQQMNGPYGADITCYAGSGDIIFAGTPYGIFHSINNGNTWTNVSNNLISIGNSWAAFNGGGKATSSNVTAMTVNGNNIFAGTVANGVYLSTDNGNSWAAVNNGLDTNNQIKALAISGSNVFAAVNDSNQVYLSTNNGTSWTASNYGLPKGIYAVTVNTFAVKGDSIFAGTDDGVYISTDNGSNWTMVGLSLNNINALAVKGNNIYAGTNTGVSIITNNGSNWTDISTGLPSLSTINALAVNGSKIFAGTWGTGIYSSSLDGNDWTAVNAGLPTFITINALTVSGSNILAGTYGSGEVLSSDNGVNWTEANTGITGNSVNAFVSDGAYMFTATSSGVFRSADNGINWTNVNNGIPASLYFYSLTTDGSNIFAGTTNGVYLSANNGNNWTSVGWRLYLGEPLVDGYISALAVDSGKVFAGTLGGGLYLYLNNGSNWLLSLGGSYTNLVTSLAASGSNMFVAKALGVLLSTDNGITWSAVNNGLPADCSVNKLAVSGTNIFAGTWGDGVYLSANSGSAWSAVNNGLPTNTYVNALATIGNNIFVGTGTDVYWSSNNGSRWIELNTGLQNYIIRSLAVIGENIFAGTIGGGVWEMKLSEITGIEELKNSPSYISVYPNPASNSITIETPEKSQLEIITVQGLPIRTIVARDNKTNVDISAFSSGEYIIIVNTGRGIVVKKFIKL